ncbi:MAG TPA: hypothetical protein VES67_06230 [Vicinamibacterales bacterium]|nr:hypothetical protein [Vicinamibacterales bacterium]
MIRRCWVALFVVSVALLSSGTPAVAQPMSRAQVDEAFDKRLGELWTRFLAAAAREAGLTVTDGRLSGPRDAKVAVYTTALDRLQADPELLRLFTPAYVQSLIDEQVESRVPTSVNATSTNPATGGLPEKSGATSLAALAADLSSLASADKTAVSLSISALALVSAKDPEIYSAITSYQRHSLARRFSGTVVFGARIPEAEITGFSGMPEFDTLLDAFGWDVKARVWGDKDPRSDRWSDDTVRRGGLLTHISSVLLTIVGRPRPGEPPQQALEDAVIVQSLLAKRLGEGIAAIKSKIAKAPQLSLKAAGTHLTKERGRNRYAFVALFDVGVGPSDLTANVQYALTDDIQLGADQLFKTKIWTVSGAVTSHLAPGAIIRGRTIDWSVGGSVAVFADKASMPVPAENTWKIFTSVDVPVGGGGKIPVSIVYTNDPNALTKEKFIRGQIGLSYDFSALKQLFTPGS